jgi:hypothetical protein
MRARLSGHVRRGNLVTSVNGLAGDVAAGTISGVTAGTGLSGGGTTGGVSLAVDTTAIQRLVTGTCVAPNAIRAVAADGTVTCGSSSPSFWEE